jgi:hypothetical protein
MITPVLAPAAARGLPNAERGARAERGAGAQTNEKRGFSMNASKHRLDRNSQFTRRSGAALALAALLSATGCNTDEAARAFRDAAADGLQTGLSAMLDGLVDGAAAVFRLGPDGMADEGEGGAGG